MLDATKIVKSQRHPKSLKILTSSTFGEHKTRGVTGCKDKRYMQNNH